MAYDLAVEKKYALEARMHVRKPRLPVTPVNNPAINMGLGEFVKSNLQIGNRRRAGIPMKTTAVDDKHFERCKERPYKSVNDIGKGQV